MVPNFWCSFIAKYYAMVFFVSRSQAAILEVPLPAPLFPPSVVFPVSFTPGVSAHFLVYLHIRVNPQLWVSRTPTPLYRP